MLRVSPNGYYSWLSRGPSRWALADRQLLPQFQPLYRRSKGRYGIRRLKQALPRQGLRVSPRRLSRLMASAGISGHSRVVRVKTTRSNGSAVAPDRVKQQFQASGPKRLWVADATYLPTREGTLYLAIIKDVFSRGIVGWSMSARQGSELMVKALQMALAKRQVRAGVIHHSDRGSPYTSAPFRRVCEAANIVQSMGAVGNCYDNAMAESFFATLEKELIHHQPRRCFATRTEARMKIFEFIEGFYNRERLHSALGFLSPAEFEQA